MLIFGETRNLGMVNDEETASGPPKEPFDKKQPWWV